MGETRKTSPKSRLCHCTTLGKALNSLSLDFPINKMGADL